MPSPSMSYADALISCETPLASTCFCQPGFSYYTARDHQGGGRTMRGTDDRSDFLFSYVSPEHRVPADHPLRPIRIMTDAALERLSPQFDAMYSAMGRPSIPPEQLLRALLLQ